MKKKIMIALPVLLIVVGGAYKFMMPAAKAAPQKLAGEIYVLPKQFTLNLQDGHFATMTVALELAAGQSDGASAAAAGGDSTTGIGTLPEEAAIRAIVTNIVTNQNSSALITATGRARIEHQILAAIGSQTDVKVTEVMLPDVAVQ